jgi:hypothetical protein
VKPACAPDGRSVRVTPAGIAGWFAGALVLAAVVAVPLLIAGSAAAIALWRSEGLSGPALMITIWVIGGVAGLFGLERARSRRKAAVSASGRIELICVCLAIGIVAALGLIAMLVLLGQALWREPLLASVVAIVATAHAVLIVGAISAASALMRQHAAGTGMPFDTLPLALLLVALGLALGAALLSATV